MIRIVPAPTFKVAVSFTEPGAVEPAVIDMEFRHKAPTALAAWWQSAQERPVATALAEVVVGWSGVIDDTGADVAFSAETLARFLEGHGPRALELFRAYVAALTESRLKN